MKKYFLFLLLCSGEYAFSQQLAPLTVEKIMRDPKWMGVSPSNYRWSADSKTLYFNWNPERKTKDELYKTSPGTNKANKAADKEDEKLLAPDYTYSKDRSLALYEKGGDIYLKNVKTQKETRLTNTVERESNPVFLLDGSIVFQKENNLYSINLQTAQTKQLSNFIAGKRPPRAETKVLGEQDKWLKEQQIDLFDIIKKRNEENKNGGRGQGGRGRFSMASADTKTIKEVYLNDAFLSNLNISPDGRYISYRLSNPASSNHNTIVPNYVTSSGYTEDIPGRTKVGENEGSSQNFILNTQKDSVYKIQTASIAGIKDLPEYFKDYPAKLDSLKKKNDDRPVTLTSPTWNEDGSIGISTAYSADNKDRWILKVDATTGKLSTLDRQHDEAWIGGPGVGGFNGAIGWLDKNRYYFQSEASGYSHIYVVNVATGEKKQLTNGNWEVQSLRLSKDKTTFYFSANKEHPGITNYFKISVNGGEPIQITSMKGLNEITLSPDEKWLAINYSFMNKPNELYLQENKVGAKAVKITSSTTAEFDSYKWREPELVSFKNRYGDDVYARIYKSEKPAASHPAVVFVHGAGYLQNVHYGWSTYFREYMFNNLLADNGYTVIDIDYTASSGYGRNHRTGIYRHMGGKDLTDQVDGVKLLVDKYGVNPKNVGLYGGSYGGFITLMAMFNQSETFKSGAALRSVTDWAHYNHGYTSNILNEPFNDPIAYKQSSPIYFADKLKGNLLMAHGMVDVNVHFQDIVRLSQRFIELGKNNWELAIYPVEDHGFVEPSSWTDEYKRIFKLFETTLK
ncbi:prolyl oligopeptidase family serine peptidase [Pedobacter sp. MW01-1-1]|uniref:prolyl oligopeptidase family serine peptidase n=1 Tax=Pedobacter sp. MW01-1-1 TaxID=3383027 RepID=UPI003FEF1489